MAKAPTSTSKRAVLFPVSDSECCSWALRWALENVARPETDVFHLAYVVPQICCRQDCRRLSQSPPLPPSPSPPSPPANPFCRPAQGNGQLLAAQAELHSARAMIRRRFVSPLLEEAGIRFETHLLEPAESGNGNRSEEVGEALVQLATALGAALVVVGGGLKGSGATGTRGGSSCGCSVTKYCLDRCPATVCVVRGVGGDGS